MTRLDRPVRRTAHVNVPHGMSPDIVVTLYPGGVLGLRESRRREEHRFSLAALLERAVIEAARDQNRRRR